jgi:hypothetical protein
MTADKREQFQVCLSDAEIEATTCSITDMDRVIKQLEREIDGITSKDHISKNHFRPGGMAPSEWTRSVRAVRDTPVADYSAPGVNTMRRFANRPLIAVSPFLLGLKISHHVHSTLSSRSVGRR